MECLLTLRRLYEGEQREGDANAEVVKNKALKPFTPVRTDNMKPFLAPAAARATSPLRRTPSPPPHPPPAAFGTNTATPDINYEAVTSQFFSHTPGELTPAFKLSFVECFMLAVHDVTEQFPS